MKPVLRVLALTFTAALVASVAVSCSGGGDDDDDDDGSTTGTPTNVDYCQIVWATPDEGAFDVFLVDAPIGQWSSGTKSYGINSPIGVFYNNQPADQSQPALSAAITTSGQFDLVLANGTVTGAGVEFTDTSNQNFFAYGQSNGVIGAKVGTGGTGTFSGVWSPPEGPLTGGDGNITIAYEGTSRLIGAQGSYAICYDRGATFEMRTRETLRHLKDL